MISFLMYYEVYCFFFVFLSFYLLASFGLVKIGWYIIGKGFKHIHICIYDGLVKDLIWYSHLMLEKYFSSSDIHSGTLTSTDAS